MYWFPAFIGIGIKSSWIEDNFFIDFSKLYTTISLFYYWLVSCFDNLKRKPIVVTVSIAISHKLGPSSRPFFLEAAFLKAFLLPAQIAL